MTNSARNDAGGASLSRTEGPALPRWLVCLLLACGLMAVLFAVLLRLAGAQSGNEVVQKNIEQVQVVDVKPPPPPPDIPPPPPPPSAPAEMPNPVPSSAPAAAAMASMASAPPISTLDVGKIAVPAGNGSGNASGVGFSGARLSGGGTFGGFAGGGAGDFGAAQGFVGKDLVPISTARPQIPEWAFKKGVSGWVEVVFVVMPNGHVNNVRIVNAEPKGVFESVAVESISNWLYAPTSKAHEVFQRVEFKLEDYKYNWTQ